MIEMGFCRMTSRVERCHLFDPDPVAQSGRNRAEAMLYDLRGRCVVITGAADGVSRQLALGMASEGATVIAVDINHEKVEATVAEIKRTGGRGVSCQLNVTDSQACRDLAARVEAEHGPIHILVNNAGIGRAHKLGDENFISVWNELIEVNLNGVVYVTLAFVEQLKRTTGSIVNIASLAISQVSNASPGYAASKAGVMQLTRTLARDLSPYGIRVNAIAPGLLNTQLTSRARADEALMANIRERTMMKRIGEPDEILGPVVFLASSMSSYVTGAVVYVDGGTSAL
jgi:NAD(P)-dependent dehydrogenase (short-subunit alcohol dehydrogenase family)